MKKYLLSACALLFISSGLLAQTPSMAPISGEAMAAILSPAAGPASCRTQQSEVLFAARRSGKPLKSICSATAQCGSTTPSSVSCQGSNSCTAVDRNCSASEPGHVTCDGTTTSCSPCSPCEVCAGTSDCFNCCRCEGNSGPFCVRECYW